MPVITSMKISPSLTSELEVGQTVNFTVTLTSNEAIDKNKSITIEYGPVKNIQFTNPTVQLKYDGVSHNATADFSFKVLSKVGEVDVKNGDQISFIIKTNAESGGVQFKDMPYTYTGKAKVNPVNKNQISITINKTADLIIGQSVSFTVNLSSDQPITERGNILIQKASNVNFAQGNNNPVRLNYIEGNREASAQLSFTVEDPTNPDVPITDGSHIGFEVHTDVKTTEGNFGFVPFSGTANEIDVDSMALFVEKPVLQMSSDSDQQTPTAIYTYLKNKHTQRPLVGTPIFITSQKRNQIEEFKFKDGDKNNPITLEDENDIKGLIITSKTDGLIKFYLYPQTALVSIVNLWSYIISTKFDIRRRAKQVIYAVNYIKPTFFDSIGIPDISDYKT
ncbi:hypothetical protein AB204_10940, partial [Xenorhabdus khoisanae]